MSKILFVIILWLYAEINCGSLFRRKSHIPGNQMKRLLGDNTMQNNSKQKFKNDLKKQKQEGSLFQPFLTKGDMEVTLDETNELLKKRLQKVAKISNSKKEAREKILLKKKKKEVDVLPYLTWQQVQKGKLMDKYTKDIERTEHQIALKKKLDQLKPVNHPIHQTNL